MSAQAIRVAIIGTGARSATLYGPLLRRFPGVELAAVWGRSEASARRLGEGLKSPWYTDLGRLIRETAPQVGIVSVAYDANGAAGLMAVEHGLHALLETPIAHRLDEADAIIKAARARGLKIEVAEQFHRRPLEQIKLQLIRAGIFGKVYSSFNDFAGHGYHGMSVMRSYLGFDAVPKRVSGLVRNFPLAPHWSRLSGKNGPRDETQEHGLVEFADGRVGAFQWTDVGYDSALRWWRSSRFLAEKGMGITVGTGEGETRERLSLLTPDGEAPRFITLERRRRAGAEGGALEAILAHTGDRADPIVRWDNPFAEADRGQAAPWTDDEIGVAGCLKSLVDAVRNNTEPTYGPLQARLDQELILALRRSSAEGGRPVDLPLDL